MKWLDLFNEIEQGRIQTARYAYNPPHGVDIQTNTNYDIIGKMSELLDKLEITLTSDDECISPRAREVLGIKE